jgi:hypothetical protein
MSHDGSGTPELCDTANLKRIGTYAILAAGFLALAVGLWKARDDGFDALEHLPTADATVANMDFVALRRAGILSLLAAKPDSEELEYLSFIHETGFDYQKDLDHLTAAFMPDATYFIAQGRFDWARLENFAKSSGGGCYERLCHLPGSAPERRISFLPLRPNIMALAVSTDDLAAARLREPKPASKMQIPGDPVWVSIPASALKRTASVLPAVRLFAATVAGADRVILTLGPNPDGDYAARLEALCNSAQVAQTIAAQLTKVTSALKNAEGKKPQDDLAGVLLTGTFQQSNQKVFGYWPIRKGLLQNLAGGM